MHTHNNVNKYCVKDYYSIIIGSVYIGLTVQLCVFAQILTESRIIIMLCMAIMLKGYEYLQWSRPG